VRNEIEGSEIKNWQLDGTEGKLPAAKRERIYLY